MLLSFIITCIVFDLYPGASFFIVALNGVQYLFSISVFTAIGVALNDGLSSLFSLILFSFIKDEKIITIIQIFSLLYLFFQSVKTIFLKEDTLRNKKISQSEKTRFSCFKDGFLISFLNPHIAIGNTAILTQFTLGKDIYIKAIYHSLLFLISLICFVAISRFFSYIKDTNLLSDSKNLVIMKKSFSWFIIFFVFYKISDLLYKIL